MKFMNMKRFGSVVMAGALALSLAAPAFAADNTTTITGGYEEIPISVVVPTTGTASINPYGLPVSLTLSTDKTVDLVGQQITTQPLSIKNQGAVKLDVNASLAVVPKGDVAIIAAAPGSSETGKEVYVKLELAGLDDAAYALSTENEKLNDLLITAFADDATWAGASSLDAPAASKGDTAADITAAKSGSTLVQLGAATVNGDTITYGKNSIALFRLNGELNAEPVKADGSDDPWATADGFTATVVFKFTPAAATPASVNLDKSTATIAASGAETLTVTFNAGDTDLTVTNIAWSSSAAAIASVPAGNTAASTTANVTNNSAGSAIITVTVTLSDNSTLTATCNVTCS